MTETNTNKLGRKSVIDRDAFFKALKESPDLSQRSLRERFGGSPANIKALKDEFFKVNADAVAVLDPASTLLSNEQFGKALTALVTVIQNHTSDPLDKTIEALSKDNKKLEKELADCTASQADYEAEVEAQQAEQAQLIEKITVELDACKSSAAALATKLEVAEAKHTTLKAELAKLQTEHKAILIEHSQMQLLLKQADEAAKATKQAALKDQETKAKKTP